MAHEHTVLRSINLPGESVCVDIFRREDGSFGFETFRRDPEDGRGWYCIGYHGEARFADEADALAGACREVAWLEGVLGGR